MAAQSTAARLVSLGEAHAAIVPLGCSREQLEGRLELFSRIIDDFELFLSRAERNSPDTLGVLDRMSIEVNWLVEHLPGYSHLEASLKSLHQTITRNKWATSKNHKSAESGDDSDGDEDVDCALLGFDPENSREDLTGAMASQFQSLLSYIVENDGDADLIPQSVSEYSSRLGALLNSDLPSDQLGPVAYFHWRFLRAFIESHLLESVQSPIGRLLFPDLRDSLRWSKDIEGRIPARFLLNIKPQDELSETANQIIAAMQRL
jgi:hypothetical protein